MGLRSGLRLPQQSGAHGDAALGKDRSDHVAAALFGAARKRRLSDDSRSEHGFSPPPRQADRCDRANDRETRRRAARLFSRHHSRLLVHARRRTTSSICATWRARLRKTNTHNEARARRGSHRHFARPGARAGRCPSTAALLPRRCNESPTRWSSRANSRSPFRPKKFYATMR